MENVMSLTQDILRLLQDEGYKVNEAVRDALADFVQIVEEETDGMDDEGFEDDDGFGDDDD